MEKEKKEGRRGGPGLIGGVLVATRHLSVLKGGRGRISLLLLGEKSRGKKKKKSLRFLLPPSGEEREASRPFGLGKLRLPFILFNQTSCRVRERGGVEPVDTLQSRILIRKRSRGEKEGSDRWCAESLWSIRIIFRRLEKVRKGDKNPLSSGWKEQEGQRAEC